MSERGICSLVKDQGPNRTGSDNSSFLSWPVCLLNPYLEVSDS